MTRHDPTSVHWCPEKMCGFKSADLLTLEEHRRRAHPDRRRTPPPERAILTDLIADLRRVHRPASTVREHTWCVHCEWPYPCQAVEAADRAQERLQELMTP